MQVECGPKERRLAGLVLSSLRLFLSSEEHAVIELKGQPGGNKKKKEECMRVCL